MYVAFHLAYMAYSTWQLSWSSVLASTEETVSFNYIFQPTTRTRYGSPRVPFCFTRFIGLLVAVLGRLVGPNTHSNYKADWQGVT